MRNLNIRICLWLLVPLTVGLWAGVLWATGTGFILNWDAVKRLPLVITLELLLWLLFSKWGWRWSALQGWLVPYPVIEGTWEGTVQTTWKDDKGQTPPPIRAILVIHQTFTTLSCTMYTAEMVSKSSAAAIVLDVESQSKRVVYTYTSTPDATVRHRSEIHQGTACLDFSADGTLTLRGEYWTTRKTTGSMAFTQRSTKPLTGRPDELTTKVTQQRPAA